jgi:type IV secretory pathway VirB2 component (pilin)
MKLSRSLTYLTSSLFCLKRCWALIVASLFLVQSSFADLVELSQIPDLPGKDFVKPGQSESQITSFLTEMIKILQDVTAIAAVIGVCIVGIMYIRSLGNEEKAESAKTYLVMIITGLFIAFSAWAIISFIDLIPNSLRW